MKALIVIGAVLILLAGLVYLGFQKIGDVRPAILPATPNSVPTSATSQPQQAGFQQVGEAVDLNLPPGFKIGLFAQNLGNARDLQFSPGGTLLVSATSVGKVYALPDKNNDGRADQVKIVLEGLARPHGLAFHQGKLFLAEETKLSRYSWDEDNQTASLDKKLLDLPKSGGHFTRSLVFKKDGTLFVTLGSTCNVCNEQQEWFAAVIVTNQDGINPRVYAKGLRNAVFIALDQNETPWVTEMGRDFLGDSLPPEEVNILKEGGDFGWPTCYGNKIHDTNFDKNTYIRDPCTDTVAPTFEIPAHNAPLGLAFVDSAQFPPDWQGDLLVALHGSWNRSVPDGYKVVHLNRQGDTLTSSEDFITGFLKGSQAVARPVDLTFDASGSLYLSDDKSGSVYKIVRE